MQKPILEVFYEICSKMIDEKGIYPHQAIFINDKDKISVCALMVPPLAVISWALKQTETAKEIVFGLDCTTKPGQGTEFADVLVVFHWERSFPTFQIGVVNYQNEPRIVRPIDWENQFWITEASKWLLQVREVTKDYQAVSVN